MTEDKYQDGELILYRTDDGVAKVEVLYQGETFWLSQKKMAELFGVDVRTISEHLQNIISTGELKENSVIRKFRITAADAKFTNCVHDRRSTIDIQQQTHDALYNEPRCHCKQLGTTVLQWHKAMIPLTPTTPA